MSVEEQYAEYTYCKRCLQVPRYVYTNRLGKEIKQPYCRFCFLAVARERQQAKKAKDPERFLEMKRKDNARYREKHREELRKRARESYKGRQQVKGVVTRAMQIALLKQENERLREMLGIAQSPLARLLPDETPKTHGNSAREAFEKEMAERYVDV